jgi:hypothetical protein
MRELHADTEAIRQERRALLDEHPRDRGPAAGGSQRGGFTIPAREDADEEMLEPEAEAETERSGAVAADKPRDGNPGPQGPVRSLTARQRRLARHRSSG